VASPANLSGKDDDAMKKQVSLFIIFAITFLLAACTIISEEARETRLTPDMPPVPIAESNTFMRQLDIIMQLAETQEEPAPTEHEIQLQRLREFAKSLNDGGIEASDIRISNINSQGGLTWGVRCERTRQVMEVSFGLRFMHEADFNNAELIKEMLDYADISETEIHITLCDTGWIGGFGGQVEEFEFLLGNRAVYEFTRPYIRLMEFAAKANSGTTYRHEIIVTRIEDTHQLHDIRTVPGPSRRFNIWLSPNIWLSTNSPDDLEIINEMLEFAGLERDTVQVGMEDAHFISGHMADFLLENDELNQLNRQTDMLIRFADLAAIYSVRRGIVIDRTVYSIGPPGPRADDYGFTVGLARHHIDNTALKEVLQVFTGIHEDNIDYKISGLMWPLGFGWVAGRGSLTPEQQMDYDALEAFMLRANAPFWYDKYLYDPVIVEIVLDGRWNYRTVDFTLSNFYIMLYDPELLEMTGREIRQHTLDLRNEIVSATGVRNIRMWVYRPGIPGRRRWLRF